jgi:poly(3-hydroxyoctanoate) depolymerase
LTATRGSAGWRTEHVRVSGVDLRVGRSYRGEGTPLLLLTGIGAHIDMWQPFERLVRGRETIALDAPGTGMSDRTRLPLRMRGLARLLAELLDELSVDQVDVLGYSFGGLLAQELAHRSPGRVRRLILCATAQGIPAIPPRPGPALMLMTPARFYHPRLFNWMVPHIAGGRTRREPRQLKRQAHARLSRPPQLVGYAFQLYAASGWSSVPWLSRLSQPTLIIAGDDDPVIPLANPRIMSRLLPDARLRVVKGGGHLFLLDEPESVIEEIHDFLDG